ncbi:protease complex subunit PrcB family protein [Paenibacillus sp. TAB 01]|uniref:protease complex subunit PrcB family protein n=1 Tax=Paenibacillus sp. TAB 01 TaxID=3368988 RepID=UPI003751182C
MQELLRQAKTKLGVSRGFERFDAGESSYIYIAGGMQSSSGYSVQLKSLREQRDAVLLRVRVNPPPPRANTQPAQNNPGMLLQMNKTSKQVRVQWTP